MYVLKCNIAVICFFFKFFIHTENRNVCPYDYTSNGKRILVHTTPTQNFNNDYILHADLQHAITMVGESDYGSNVVVPYGFELDVSACN